MRKWRRVVGSLISFLSVFIAAATAQPVGSAWVALGPPIPPGHTLSVTALAVAPTTPVTIYAGILTEDTVAVMRSTDEGATWQTLPLAVALPVLLDLIPHGGVTALAVDPQTPTTVYAGTLVQGLWKSNNGGDTWEHLTEDLGEDRTIYAIMPDPRTPDTLYVGTDTGLWRSTTGGATWAHLLITSGTTVINAVAVGSSTPRTLYVAEICDDDSVPTLCESLIRYSVDGGTQWHVGTGTGHTGRVQPTALVVDPTTPTTAYAGSYCVPIPPFRCPQGILRTTDGGQTWQALPFQGGVLSLALDTQALYAGVIASWDQGETWLPIKAGARFAPLVLAVGPPATSQLYAGSIFGGVFARTVLPRYVAPGASTWTITRRVVPGSRVSSWRTMTRCTPVMPRWSSLRREACGASS